MDNGDEAALKELRDYITHAEECTENIVKRNCQFPRSRTGHLPIVLTAEQGIRSDGKCNPEERELLRKKYMNRLGQEGLPLPLSKRRK